MATATAQPQGRIVDERKIGLLQATIWENQGERGLFQTVALRRSFKVGENWRESKISLSPQDLLVVARMLGWAFDRVAEEQATTN